MKIKTALAALAAAAFAWPAAPAVAAPQGFTLTVHAVPVTTGNLTVAYVCKAHAIAAVQVRITSCGINTQARSTSVGPVAVAAGVEMVPFGPYEVCASATSVNLVDGRTESKSVCGH